MSSILKIFLIIVAAWITSLICWIIIGGVALLVIGLTCPSEIYMLMYNTYVAIIRFFLTLKLPK